jgi:hypothetical protein
MTTLLVFCACRYGEELDRTIFIADEDDHNLPAYSEWGYNAFGAKYERSYFLSSNNITPCKAVYKEGILHFSLHGYLNLPEVNANSRQQQMSLTFSFPSSTKETYQDLQKLGETDIDLSLCTVEIKRDNVAVEIENVSGHLIFKRTQLLRIDGVENRVILSGTFDMSFFNNNIPNKISNGRFDVGINDDFYSFE